jgi:hypothetical protein
MADKLRSASGTGRSDIATLSALNRYPRLGLPFATFGDPAVETYVLSRGKAQPEYYMSVVGVYIGLYLALPAHADVFCVDEKTAIEALDRPNPALPLSPGRTERHGF